ncbi:MAG: hypothetical protein JNL84_10655 [Candidatus Accumulibacter sp.]|nr:hypothetical protein [Accumulibacter sp.]
MLQNTTTVYDRASRFFTGGIPMARIPDTEFERLNWLPAILDLWLND